MPLDRLQIALEHHRGGRLRQAEAGYRAVLGDEPEHPDALHWLGVLTLQTGLADAAVPLLQRAADRRPDDPAFAHNLGQALLSAGRADDSIRAFERATKLDPANASTFLAIGLAHVARNASLAALDALERARALGLDSAELHHRLAVALLKIGRPADAITACRAAIERKADYASAYHHLAVALRSIGATHDAREALRKAVELDPALARAWHGLAVMEAESGKVEDAVALFRRAIEAKPDYAAAYQGLARVLAQTGRQDEARRVMADAAKVSQTASESPRSKRPASVSGAIAELEEKLTPEGKGSSMHYALATLLNVFPPAQSPASGVTKLFDGYADRFDEHLEGKLGYRVPTLLAEAVAETRPTELLDVLDLGCGTGLCGAALRPLARRLAGVDLAPAMIAKSTERGVYDELTCGEMLDVLRRCGPASLDLIVATDVFIYVGDLVPAFEAATDALRPGGMLAFSVEAGAGDRYYLQPTRRYAHSQPYVERLAGIFGFAVERFTTISVRIEAGRHLPGYLVLLRMPKAE